MPECLRAERTRKRSRDIDPVAECFAVRRVDAIVTDLFIHSRAARRFDILRTCAFIAQEVGCYDPLASERSIDLCAYLEQTLQITRSLLALVLNSPCEMNEITGIITHDSARYECTYPISICKAYVRR